MLTLYFGCWLSVVGLGISGILLVHFEYFFGSQSVEEVHEIFANAVIVFIVIRFTGILLDSILHKRKTWMNIITGKK